MSPAIPKVKRKLYWKCFNSIPDSVCDSEISSDDSGTDDLGIVIHLEAVEAALTMQRRSVGAILTPL